MSTTNQPSEASPAEIEAKRRRDAVATETGGMAAAFAALLPLDRDARTRALRWLGDALRTYEEEPPF